jgi:hypothetical protein
MPDEDQTAQNPKIKRGRLASLSLYEVTDYELEILQAGSPATILLNFAIFLLSTALSFWVAVFGTEIKDPNRYAVFMMIAIFATINGVLLLVLWWRKRGSVAQLVAKIKRRISADTVAPSLGETGPTGAAASSETG